MTMTKKFLSVFEGKPQSPPPIWMMRQAGRYLPEYREVRATTSSFLNFCYTPDAAVEVTLQPLRRYNFDAAILFADILVIPDALGQHVEFQEGVGPVLDPIRDAEGLSQLNIDQVVTYLDPVLQTVARLSKEIPETTSLIGFAGAPWTVGIYMVEGKGGTECERARDWAYKDPVGFGKLIDILTEATAQYLIAQAKAGAEALQIFDSWAGVLSPSQFRDYVIGPTAKIVSRIRAECPDVPILGFPRHGGPMIPEYIEKTGVDGVSLDQTVPLEWAIQALPETCVLQGNLDNRLLVVGGDAMNKAIDDILETMKDRPFVFNLGHGIVPQTPPEHVGAAVARIRGE